MICVGANKKDMDLDNPLSERWVSRDCFMMCPFIWVSRVIVTDWPRLLGESSCITTKSTYLLLNFLCQANAPLTSGKLRCHNDI